MFSHVGLDFDNTIVRYDEVFHRYAVELFDMPSNIPADKPSIKKHFWTYKDNGGRDHWVKLQGIVYGEKIAEASLSSGLEFFLQRLRDDGIRVSIISHKTEYPARGPKVRLWDAAWDWLEKQRFFDPDRFALSRDDVFFEKERSLKLNRLASQGCDVFIDDLLEVLQEADFPSGVRRILYDPADRQELSNPEVDKCRTWEEINDFITGIHA